LATQEEVAGIPTSPLTLGGGAGGCIASMLLSLKLEYQKPRQIILVIEVLATLVEGKIRGRLQEVVPRSGLSEV
jgi:hypothetical protein